MTWRPCNGTSLTILTSQHATHLEDLESRMRLNNVRAIGLPERVEGKNLLFNLLKNGSLPSSAKRCSLQCFQWRGCTGSWLGLHSQEPHRVNSCSNALIISIEMQSFTTPEPVTNISTRANIHKQRTNIMPTMPVHRSRVCVRARTHTN